MGYPLLLAYIALSYLRPYELYPALAAVRPMMALGGVAILTSFLSLPRTMNNFMTLQVPLVGLLICVIVVSRLRWLSGALDAFQDIMITMIVFYLVLATVRTIKDLRRVGFVLAGCSVLLALQAAAAMKLGFRPDLLIIEQTVPGGDIIYRARALGYFADPNDLAQALLIALPIIGTSWKKRHNVRNLFLVIVPGLVLLYGVYLTRSRGAILGLLILGLLVMRRKAGNFLATAMTTGVLMAVLAAGVTGGRGMSSQESSAAVRLDAWYAGISMLQGSPLLGVGFNQFTEHHIKTAHNSFVLCFAELGIIGYFIWLGMIVVTILQLNPIARKDAPYEESLRKWARAIQLSLYVFLATAWFLSRTYVVTLYLLIAMAIIVVRLARQQRFEPAKEGMPWWMVTMMIQIVTIGAVWAMVRFRGMG